MEKISHCTFISRVNVLHNNDYSVIGVYENNSTPIQIKHNICSKTFNSRPSDFLGTRNRKGTQCPHCSHPSKKFSKTEVHQKVSDLTNGEYKLLGEYTNTHTHTEFIHIVCGNTFSMRPNNFIIKGNRCPLCSSSKGEDLVSEFLIDSGLHFEREVRFKEIGRRRFDFRVWLNSKDFLLIEYDGKFHFESCGESEKSIKKFKEQIESDNIKNQFCMENKLVLLRIPYHELDNLYDKLKVLFNDYLLSESTAQVIGVGNKSLLQYLIL